MQHVLGLIRPAIQEIEAGQPDASFARLAERIRSFGTFHVRYGFQRPEWIDDLENAIDRAHLNLEILDRPWEWLRTSWEKTDVTYRQRTEIVREVVEWGRITRRNFQILFSPPEEDHSK